MALIFRGYRVTDGPRWRNGMSATTQNEVGSMLQADAKRRIALQPYLIISNVLPLTASI